jgi:hypothetical protein
VVVAQIRWIAWPTFIPHNRTVQSVLPLARVCPSGLNTTEVTAFGVAGQGLAQGVGWAGSVTFHRVTKEAAARKESADDDAVLVSTRRSGRPG